ncbi:TetR/AcrR family transcriptional regulator, partial [Nocardia salmonicida]
FYGSGIPEFEPRLRMLIKLYLLQIIGPIKHVDIDVMSFVVLNAGFATALRSVELDDVELEAIIAGTADMISAWIDAVSAAENA